MAYLNVVVKDSVGNKQDEVEVPDDVPVKRLLVVLVEKLRYPKHSGDGGQLLSYKLHHVASAQQLTDDQSLQQAGVRDGDILRMQAEIIAG
jgi:uncharacterized ubiquitin-like protein YukD